MPMPDGGTYWVASTGGEPVAGMFDMSGPETGHAGKLDGLYRRR